MLDLSTISLMLDVGWMSEIVECLLLLGLLVGCVDKLFSMDVVFVVRLRGGKYTTTESPICLTHVHCHVVRRCTASKHITQARSNRTLHHLSPKS